MFLFFVFLQTAVISAESLVTTIVGGVLALAGTQLVKSYVPFQGPAATLVALVIAFFVGFAAFLINAIWNDGQASWNLIFQNSAQVFGLATLAYNLFMKDRTV